MERKKYVIEFVLDDKILRTLYYEYGEKSMQEVRYV